MCRNIRTLANFDPPATDEEIRAFGRAVDEVAAAARRLVDALTTSAPSRNRDAEAHKARERARARFAG